MRLLHVWSLEFQHFDADPPPPPYAILSHRWTTSEARLADIERWHADLPEEYTKVLGFTRYVRIFLPDIRWIWIDSCCINQDSSAELSEAVNRMFEWYRDARVCLAYLPDVEHRANRLALRKSVWFKRGWTLQELVASTVVVFLATNWQVIGHKGDATHLNGQVEVGVNLEPLLSEVTNIPQNVLQDYSNSRSLGFGEKMLWMEGRQTSKEEDMIYALFGIFNVTPGANYGEGKRGAELRLRDAIQRRDSHEVNTTLDAKPRATALADKIPEFSIFLGVLPHEPPRGTEGGPVKSSRMSRKTLNQVFVKGDDGVVAYIAAHSPRAANLAERYASVLPERPNISHELRWKLYIYCAPNIYHLNTALHIARHLIGFNGVIRVDANLSDDSTEDTNASPRLLFSLQDLADLLEEIESDWKLKKDYSRSWASSDFDQSWLQNHIDELENGDSFMAERTLERYIRLAADDQRVAGIVILGTAPTAMNMLTKIPNLQPVVMRESRHYWLKPHSSGNGWSVTPLGWL